jgi:hypothetical protein
VIVNLENFTSSCGIPQINASSFPTSWSGNVNSKVGDCQFHGTLSVNVTSNSNNIPLQLVIGLGGPNFGINCGNNNNNNNNNNNGYPTGFPLNLGSSEQVSTNVTWQQDKCQFNGVVNANFQNQTSSNYPAGYVIDIGVTFQNVTAKCQQGSTGTSSGTSSVTHNAAAGVNVTTSGSQITLPSFFSLVSLLSLFFMGRN